MILDHFAWSSPSLDKAIADVEEWSGIRAAPGGSHPGMGTRNALLSLRDGLYLAIDAPDPGQQLVTNNGARMAAQPGYNMDLFAVATDDIQAAQSILERFGLAAELRTGSRKTLRGEILKWRHLAVEPSRFGNALPHISQWETANHPSLEAPIGCTLERFEVAHPLAESVRELYAALDLTIDVVRAERPSLRVSLRGRHGAFDLPSYSA
ncbi:polyphosphate kinase [Mesorhizobium sp. 113-3-9]|uniref:VOC family protein n=1 Tax=Mesorhizobium sp. 113-3-9 TaxID=2744517 RepID=UPI001925B2A4|nr:VOC family protein [Mesorhizobium sp. 113-3-9]BCG84444.1 polyphosphate kinase [Mesorhizobium sp. 113-3-9]